MSSDCNNFKNKAKSLQPLSLDIFRPLSCDSNQSTITNSEAMSSGRNTPSSFNIRFQIEPVQLPVTPEPSPLPSPLPSSKPPVKCLLNGENASWDHLITITSMDSFKSMNSCPDFTINDSSKDKVFFVNPVGPEKDPIYYSPSGGGMNIRKCNSCPAGLDKREPPGTLETLHFFRHLIIKYLITFPLLSLFIWALLYCFWGELALPGGTIFALVALFVFSLTMGFLFESLTLPPLTGMLISGLILRNVPYINVGKDLTFGTSAPLRGIAVVILLTRGALGVNVKNIRKFKSIVPLLSIGCCAIDAVLGTLSLHFFVGMSPLWAAVLGCIMSAMSGPVVMPYLLTIEGKVENYLPEEELSSRARGTVAIAKTACGLDSILAVCMGQTVMGFILAEGDISQGILIGFGEVMVGVIFGLLWGGLTGIILSEISNPDLKIIFIFCGGIVSLLGLGKIGYPKGGQVGVFMGSLIAANTWRWKNIDVEPVIRNFDKLWIVFQPLLLGIIGARINFETVEWPVVYKAIVVMAICMTGRMIASFSLASCSNLNLSEKLFLAVAWCGKGTVQASMGPVALDTVMDLGIERYIKAAYQVMYLSAVAILFYSILGFLLLKLFGKRSLFNKKNRTT